MAWASHLDQAAACPGTAGCASLGTAGPLRPMGSPRDMTARIERGSGHTAEGDSGSAEEG